MIPRTFLLFICVVFVNFSPATAHIISDDESTTIHAPHYDSSIKPPNRILIALAEAAVNQGSGWSPEAMRDSFLPFSPTVKTRWDRDFFYIESNSMPDHRMMVNIKAWNQQVPLPQPYTGDNAFRLPLFPSFAEIPISAKETLFKGSIAVAINGVPIFNPIKQDGRTDTYLAGELDEFGGHAGRADDYHYHIAPMHLQNESGKSHPIAWALDGYPIFGYTEVDGSPAINLDWLNGHQDKGGHYHYHATKNYPYLNGGFKGEIALRNGEVDIQPRSQGVREFTRPLRGARITGFSTSKPNHYQLSYKYDNESYTINYSISDDGTYPFTFTDADGQKETQIYSRRERRSQRPQIQDPRRREGDGERARGKRGPDPDDPNRQPWLKVHAPEMDENKDGSLSYAELTQEISKTFRGYDANNDDKLSQSEYVDGRGLRSALGGFVKQHADEIDSDNNSFLTHDELVNVVSKMFRKGDRNQNDVISPQEFSSMKAGGGKDKSRRGNKKGETKDRQSGQNKPSRGKSEQEKGRGGPPAPEPAKVPYYDYNIILGRPTDRSITASVLSWKNMLAHIEWGENKGRFDFKSDTLQLTKGKTEQFLLKGLKANTRYYYRLEHKDATGTTVQRSAEYSFVTQRQSGEDFTFTIQADSHLDQNTSPILYERTLSNAASNNPDFHIDLGDTFMTDKFKDDYTTSTSQYLAQRYYFGLLSHSAPLFMVLGNHDGESGWSDNGSQYSMAVWSNEMRNHYFPNPVPDSFYTGNPAPHPQAQLLENYYAYTWGDALFIVLDPFWPTQSKGGRDVDGWGRTLGDAQYQWLQKTLETNDTKYTFVFIHHLVGGANREARGGAEASHYLEWGGKNWDGINQFKSKRPNWPTPIHELLVQHKVSAVFHGHDHLYVQQERDGIIYQTVPQPGNPRYGGTRSAAEYGYLSGEIQGNSGHLRVFVTPEKATIAYVRSYLSKDENTRLTNKQITHQYSIEPSF